MIYLGIDPGLTGALAAVTAAGKFIVVADLPVMASGGKCARVQRCIDPSGLRELLSQVRHGLLGEDIAMAAIERVAARPGQGVSSTFSLGDSFGAIRAVLAYRLVPCEFPSPAVWKRAMGLDGDKERSRAKAIQLFPEATPFLLRKKDHNRAEALLLAEWIRRERV